MKNVLSVLILFIGFNAFPQSAESLKAAAKKLFEANYLMDFETIISYSYPKMIEVAGHDALLEKIEKHYENEEYRLRFQLQTVPFQYSEIRKIDGRSFCIIQCQNPVRYTFETKLDPETVTAKTSWLKEINKTQQVTFEPGRNSFNVRKTTIFVAITDVTTSNSWKFFNLDDKAQSESFVGIFGESLKKELGL